MSVSNRSRGCSQRFAPTDAVLMSSRSRSTALIPAFVFALGLAVVGWIAAVERTTVLRARRVEMTKGGAPGRVSANVEFGQ